MAEVLSNQALPKGPKLAVITNAGGPAVLATDAVVLEGAQLAPLTKETTEALSTFLPPAWSKGNPVDLLGDASAERYRQAASLVLNDPMVDGVLFILTPQDITDPYRTAEAIVSLSKTTTKTILASWMGGESVQKGHTLLANAGIPSFSYPDEAAKSFAFMWKYASLIQTLYAIPETDYQPFQKEVARQKTVREALQRYREEGKLTLSESESKEIMKMWGFSVLESFKAFSEEEAVKLARRIGYPVVLKLESNVVTHKAQMGGVQLNLEKEEEVRQAFRSIYENTVLRYSKEAFHGVSVQKMVHEKGIEVIVGSSTDPQVGPTIMFGAGGALVELFRDVTISLPPLNTVFASHILEKTKISKALKNKKSVVQFLVEFADLISSVSEIKECDLNPILVGDEGTLILDARIILFSGHPIEPILRPYPIQYVEAKTLLDGRSLLFRPIRSDDESLLVQFHQSLSDEVVRLSYLSNFPLATRASHKRLSRVCFSDFDQDMILLAEFQNNESRQIEGAVRLTRINETNVWDLKFVIPSVIRTSEICELFFLQMMKVAEQERVTAISASVLAEDSCLISLLEKHGFSPYGRQNHIRRYVTFSCVANS